MTYTKEERKIIEQMVEEFSMVHSKEKRREALGWYSLASSIKDTAKVEKIMKDINAI